MKFSEKSNAMKQYLKYKNTVFAPVSDETFKGENGKMYERRVEYVFSPSAETSDHRMDCDLKVDSMMMDCAYLSVDVIYDEKLVYNTWRKPEDFEHIFLQLKDVATVRVVLTYLKVNTILLNAVEAV